MDENSLKLLLAQGVSVEEIGRRFDRHPSTVAYWMGKFGLEAPNREKHAAKGGIDRERLEGMVNRDMAIAEIADAVGLSKTTVRHWLKRYELKTNNKVGPRIMAESVIAKEAGLLTMVAACPRHGETTYILEGRGYYRCQRCRVEQIARHRRKLKETLVADAGGRCRGVRIRPVHRGAAVSSSGPGRQTDRNQRGRADPVAANAAGGGREMRAAVRELPRRGRTRHSGSCPRVMARGFASGAVSAVAQFRSGVAQLAEHATVNRRVVGSSPTPGATRERPRP